MRRERTAVTAVLVLLGMSSPLAAERPSPFHRALDKVQDNAPEPTPDAASPTAQIVRSSTRTARIEGQPQQILTPALVCRYATSFDLVWWDKGSGAAMDIAIYSPGCPAGWSRVAHLALPHYGSAEGNKTLIVQYDPNDPPGDAQGPYLLPPLRYERVWYDGGSGADWDGSFWWPVPPTGYATLSYVGVRGHGTPRGNETIMCVREDLVYHAGWIGHVWTDRKSGADQDGAVWSFTVADAHKDDPFLVPNGMGAARSHGSHPPHAVYVLKGLSSEDARTDAESGYTNLHRDGIVRVVEDATEAAAADVQSAAMSAKSQLEALRVPASEQADEERQTPRNRDEELAGGETARHDLPEVRFRTPDFRDAGAALDAAGSSIDLDGVPGLDNVGLVRGVTLTNATFNQGDSIASEPGQPWMCLAGDAEIDFEHAGRVTGRVIVLSRLYRELGLRTGIAVLLPAHLAARHVPELDDAPLDQLEFSHLAITWANEKHAWITGELPALVHDELAAYTGSEDASLTFLKDESAWLTATVDDNSLLAAPMSVLLAEPLRVLFTAQYPAARGTWLSLRAQLLSRIVPDLLPDGLSLETPDLELTVGDFNGAVLWTELHLDLSGSVSVDLPLRIDFPLGSLPGVDGVSVTGLIPGVWNNPMGIQGLSLSDLKVGGSFGGTMPSLGLGGHLDMGDGWVFDLPLDDLKVKNPLFSIAQVTVPALNLRQGLTFSGDFFLDTAPLGGAYVWMLPDQGMECSAWVDEVRLGPVAITGAGPDKRDNTGDDAPILDLQYWPPSRAPYTLAQHCYLSGRADLAGVPMAAFIDIGKSHVAVRLDGELGGVFETQLHGSGSHALLTDVAQGGSMELEGTVRGGAVADIGAAARSRASGNRWVEMATSMSGYSLLTLKSIELQGTLAGMANGDVAQVRATGCAFGTGVTATVDHYALSRGTDPLVRELADEIIGAAETMVRTAQQFLHLLCHGMDALGPDVVGRATAAFGRSPEEQYDSVVSGAEDAGRRAAEAAEVGSRMAAQTAQQAAATAESVAREVEQTMEDIASGAWDVVSGWF